MCVDDALFFGHLSPVRNQNKLTLNPDHFCTAITLSPPPSLQNTVGATTSKDHPRKIVFAQQIGHCVRSKYQPDVDKVVEYLQRKDRKLAKVEAEAAAKSRTWGQYVRTFSRPVEETVAGLEKVLAEHAALDAIGRARGELPLLRPELPAGKSGPIGTTSAAKRLISCLRKGCGQDPLGVDDM